jgi:hypothetical protein
MKKGVDSGDIHGAGETLEPQSAEVLGDVEGSANRITCRPRGVVRQRGGEGGGKPASVQGRGDASDDGDTESAANQACGIVDRGADTGLVR